MGYRIIYFLLFSLLLTSCDESFDETNNNPPVAIAGPDQSQLRGSTITLDGSGSSDADGDALTYIWTLTSIPENSVAALSDGTSQAPTFVADKTGSYVVSLVVNDGQASSETDEVVVTAMNNTPVAVAGPDQNQLRGAAISLDGSASSDADGDVLTYAWTLTSVPAGSAAALSNPVSQTPTFVADMLGTYTASLVVDDGTDASVADEIQVVVNKVIIYENDFSVNSLTDFIVGEVGSALVSIQGGQLKIAPGEGYLNRGYATLDLSAISADYPTLFSDASRIIWAFNVSNIDGAVCGSCNNMYQFYLSGVTDTKSPGGFGYALRGGGFVGSRVMFSPYGVLSSTIVDLADGPETQPIIGAFRIEYDSTTNQWDLYFEESTSVLDPMMITTLAGSGVNTDFVNVSLPYLIMGSENTNSAYFDNLTVLVEFPI